DEKRIRALFSEQRFVDEQTAPAFTAVWHRGQSRSMKPRRAFNLSLVTSTALLILALGSLVIWTKYWQNPAPAHKEAVIAADNLPKSRIEKNPGAVSTGVPDNSRPSPQKARRPRLSQRQEMMVHNREMVKEVKALGSWQSPTASLLSSTSDDLFKSLPQLKENATELKSFLPNRENDKEK